MICVRCARPIGPDEDPCDFHERDCAIELTERCWCDSAQKLHRACCMKCNVRAKAAARAAAHATPYVNREDHR